MHSLESKRTKYESTVAIMAKHYFNLKNICIKQVLRVLSEFLPV